MNRLKELETLGQSLWLDFLSREFLAGDEFKRMIAEDGLKGMTSNPSIFEKAFAHGSAYDDDIRKLTEAGCGVGAIFRKLAVADIQHAADAFRPIYDRLNGADGFISLEVSPYIAKDTNATVAEAKQLWSEVNRPNLMIKVPATNEGLPAIRDLLGTGLNINITLLFSRDVYEQVANAYIEGLEMRPKEEDLSRISSVASFFVSRIDSKVDKAIDEKLNNGADPALAGLHGKIAVANAKLAYQQYKRIFSGPRWDALAKRGARPQRLLWASTSTKNKAYSDVLYVDTLIGDDTVNTMPQETIEAFRDHGNPRLTIEEDVPESIRQLETLHASGISLDAITRELVDEGVQLFADAADKLYGALAEKRAKVLSGKVVSVDFQLGNADEAVAAEVKKRTASGDARRLWARDKSLWTSKDESKWLGWLDIAEREAADQRTYDAFQHWVKENGFSDAVLLGMGGSSLGAEVLNRVFGATDGWPKLHVLDSTDPGQISAVESAIDISKTCFIVSSKSGTTLEPNILMDYFFAKSGAGAEKRFIAITDPGSALEQVAKEKGFAHMFHGDPEIGGRYSILSKFGLIPGAAMGLDIAHICSETQTFVRASDAFVPPPSNLGVRLGIALGMLATQFSRDKITIVASPELASLGLWLEQLIAESTGKQGKGLIPIDNEPLGEPQVYGNDRVFVQIGTGSADANTSKLDALAKAGHPIVRVQLNDKYQIGQAFFLFEMAIATAGAVIGINPFDQPDVEAAKVKARDLTDAYEKGGGATEEKPVFSHDGIAVFADGNNAVTVRGANTLAKAMQAHLNSISDGDYFALLAFLQPNEESKGTLQDIRLRVRDDKHVATCREFGPRYLHSTGQAYKGGPNSGVFIEITCDHPHDLSIPGRKATFALVEKAQALGDLAVLNERGRRVVRVHLKDGESGLASLRDAVEEALQ
ncbi:MAG TPA: bifunctional transaldolase/phosoglucose isomerase [Rhizomicrobium sp.]|jgi:transaldolase/glucose-6-phosphate isomerase|nr:bifunctional transaldolase/phosoglucose isomerase [Rhizomicrobium sp.]